MTGMNWGRLINDLRYAIHCVTSASLCATAASLLAIEVHTAGILPLTAMLTARVATSVMVFATLTLVGIASGGLHCDPTTDDQDSEVAA
jgi:hypothetical protein